MREHSIISPSSGHRRAKCPGSAMLSALMPQQPEGDAAKRGHAMHLAAKTSDYTKLTQSDAVIVADYLKLLPAKAALEWRIGSFPGTTLTSRVHPLHFGTADATWTIDDTIYIVDFKTGKWPVPAKENLQLVGYAAEFEPGYKRALGIYQPTESKKIQWWNLDHVEFAHYEQQYKADCEASFDESPPLVPGDHCKFCPAEKACKVIRAQQEPTSKEW